MTNRMTDSPLADHSIDPKSFTECGSPEEIAAAALGQGKQLVKKLEQVVSANPAVALGAAVATGLVLGWWVKRK
ncbi:hypothetical protein [Symmachiella dynata]|uniref:DUF883 domain-containing protein n=1 Tax=Symmachiella dynata TaxID=2527995 RepID=A0A517ZUK5_9PLAN|nr:hypothetical protein [Symmachiella dynata]QDT50448.1 hypothetical protein Pan258_45070 [Symmachiella dynata]QDU46167.1 hypothetical protein Mal52_46660 [Symmachiella dynata]